MLTYQAFWAPACAPASPLLAAWEWQLLQQAGFSLQLRSCPLWATQVKSCSGLQLFTQVELKSYPVLQVFSGLLIGAMLPYWFSAMTMKSVGKAALAMVEEVRRQFSTISGLMEGTARPDYRRCVEISTAVSQAPLHCSAGLSVHAFDVPCCL